MTRLALSVHGVVQGVGFRPFVRRAALERGLAGWVQNRRGSVHIEVQGDEGDVASFVRALRREVPPPACVERLEQRIVAERSTDDFAIVPSASDGETSTALPPDLATCDDCLAEVIDSSKRRHGYPFTNCTRCGPRWTIVLGQPYDRESTTMRGFPLCAACRREHDDPDDRRYHAQPIACPACGPQLSCTSSEIADALRAGLVVALRGLGGFQLLVDATNDHAVARLRMRKRRPDKPMAIMFQDVEQLRAHACPTEAEIRALRSPAAPIVLLDPSRPSWLSPSTPWLGGMLPTTPLHHLILRALGRPVVCTSGNVSREPMCTTRAEAERDLEGVPDLIADHDRPIARPVDDSVVRVGTRGVEVMRRGRGFAPRPVARIRGAVLAVGAHMNSTVALAHRGELLLSQHLGDLSTVRARDLHADTVRDLCAFHDATPEVVACDAHPDYASTQLAVELARRWDVPLVRVQHHHAHVAAVMAEHGLDGEVLGLAWDGVGLGDDGTLWGGEALVCTATGYERVSHVPPFPLPGGEQAIREPVRSAIGLLHALGIDPARCALNPAKYLPMMTGRVCCPMSSSMGRLFDAVAAMLGIVREATFDGHAPLALQAVAARCTEEVTPYPASVPELILAIVEDIERGAAIERVGKRFHLAVIELGVAAAKEAKRRRVVLGGGCFANRILADGLHRRLAEEGFEVYTGRMIPPGDNGIAAGQAWVAACA